MALPPGVTVRYADYQPPEEIRKSYVEVASITAPDIVTDLESMRGLADESEDFIVANHVLEHVEDPLRALSSIARVLRIGGVAFLALPDKRFTFDKDRAITPLAHLTKDHREGPDWSLAGHYNEWCRCIDGLQGAAHAQKVSVMLAQRSNIHFHVWDYPAMLELFAYVAGDAATGLDVEMSVLNVPEVIWILRKRGKQG